MLRQLGFFICILFFSGSMVLIGARDMRNALPKPEETEVERAKKLIQSLRGDELFKIEAKYSEAHEKPERRPGSYLPDYDLRKIKKFLGSMIGVEEDGSATPPEDQDKK